MRPQTLDSRTIYQAAFEGDTSAVLAFLDAGTDVDSVDAHSGDTPLLFAIENLHDEVVRVLLARGANPNKLGYGGTTPLQAAIDAAVEQAKHTFDLTGKVAPAATVAVELLLTAGADPLQVGANGTTALDWANRHQHWQAATLIEAHLLGKR